MSDNDLAVQQARAAIENWLALIDRADHENTLATAASIFRSALTTKQWGAALAQVQGPLGVALERRIESEQYTEELPGVPDGEYVVTIYSTKFERKKNGTETVTAMKDEDGEWRVAGYFVK